MIWLPKNARPRADGTIDMPKRGVPRTYDGWIQDVRNPWRHYPEGSLDECDYRISVVETLPCCGPTKRMKCSILSIPINYNTCAKCKGTEAGIASIQEILNG